MWRRRRGNDHELRPLRRFNVRGLTPIERSPEFMRCYGCGPENELGLRLEFGIDEKHRRVEARWTPAGGFAGYKTMVHGGVIATMLDEGMGWALWGLARKTGVTRELKIRFLRPVMIEHEYLVHGWVETSDDALAVVRSAVVDGRGRVVAEATGEWSLISPEKVRDR
jgi:acyl-coenzyme A thioesterase PaaI-like protein